jgi:hypothetical protein
MRWGEVGKGRRVREGDLEGGVQVRFNASSERWSAGGSSAVSAGVDAGETETGAPVCECGVAGVESRGAVRC